MNIKLDPTIEDAAQLLTDGTILVNPQNPSAADALSEAIAAYRHQIADGRQVFEVPFVGPTESSRSVVRSNLCQILP